MEFELESKQNRLLAALPRREWLHWRPHLERIRLPSGSVLFEPGVTLTQIIFPTSAIISLLYATQNNEGSEIALVGSEGVVGVSAFMGGQPGLGKAVVRSAGIGFRLPVTLVTEAFERGGVAPDLLLRYTQTLITQMSQTAACNRHHSLEQQLCRWLLNSHDALRSRRLSLTQKQIAGMLGVRRQGVSEITALLERSGLIACRRGQITLLDRHGLEERTCECYAVVRREYDRLLPEAGHERQ